MPFISRPAKRLLNSLLEIIAGFQNTLPSTMRHYVDLSLETGNWEFGL